MCALFPLSQEQTETPSAQPRADERPLPDIPTLLRDIGKNQRVLEELRQLYTCHLSEEEDKMDSDGKVKSRTVKDYDVFYIGDEQALHLLAKDGKPLAGSEKKEEDERFNKEFDKLKKKQAELAADPKKQAKKEEEDEAQISDFLRAELFTNPRREIFRGHEVIAFDFNGNPELQAEETDRQHHPEAFRRHVGGRAGARNRAAGGAIRRIRENRRRHARVAAERLKFRLRAGEDQRGGLAAVLRGGAFRGRIVFVKLKRNAIDHYTDYKKFRSGAALGATTPAQQSVSSRIRFSGEGSAFRPRLFVVIPNPRAVCGVRDLSSLDRVASASHEERFLARLKSVGTSE